MLIGFPLALACQISQASSSPGWMRQTHSLSPGLARFPVLIAPYSESLKQRLKQDLHAAGPSIDRIGHPKAGNSCSGLRGHKERARGCVEGPELDCLGSNPRSPHLIPLQLADPVTNPSVLWLPPVKKEIITERQRKSMRLK